MKSRKPKFVNVIAFNEYREFPEDLDVTKSNRNAAKARRKKLRK